MDALFGGVVGGGASRPPLGIEEYERVVEENGSTTAPPGAAGAVPDLRRSGGGRTGGSVHSPLSTSTQHNARPPRSRRRTAQPRENDETSCFRLIEHKQQQQQRSSRRAQSAEPRGAPLDRTLRAEQRRGNAQQQQKKKSASIPLAAHEAALRAERDEVERLRRENQRLRAAAAAGTTSSPLPLAALEAELHAAVSALTDASSSAQETDAAFFAASSNEELKARVDSLSTLITLHPDHAQRLRDDTAAWTRAELERAPAALAAVRSRVPRDVSLKSVADLTNALGGDVKLARRVHGVKALHLVRMHPDDLAKIHPSDLHHRYATLDLDVVECRAVWLAGVKDAPFDDRNDATRHKREWRRQLEVRMLGSKDDDERASLFDVDSLGPFDVDPPRRRHATVIELSIPAKF